MSDLAVADLAVADAAGAAIASAPVVTLTAAVTAAAAASAAVRHLVPALRALIRCPSVEPATTRIATAEKPGR
ncbi:hypothetical protein [Angustibacter luteus]|uniref:hypothetical protein n=1 Tax=Angustibacter luteus TaxID=658456 RepID=UPI0031EAC098